MTFLKLFEYFFFLFQKLKFGIGQIVICFSEKIFSLLIFYLQ